MKNEVVSSLLESAHEFVEESLRNFVEGKLRFAIVHAVTATELVLKERLARLNPALVFKDIDTKTPHREQTVSLGALPRRLANLGMPLAPTQAQLIRDIAEWRHQIIHHMPAFDIPTAQRQIPQLLDFLASFLRTELDTPLETFLPKDLYVTAHGLLTDWKKVVSIAQDDAIKEGNVIPDSCPRCGAVQVMCLRPNAAVHCHLCGAGLYHHDRCDACGRRTVSSYGFGETDICDNCIEAAGEEHVQMQIDIAR